VTGARAGEEDLIEVPFIPRPRPSVAELIAVVLTNLATPIPHRRAE